MPGADRDAGKGGSAPEFTYTWTGLKDTDPQGNPYTYYVREPNVEDGRISIGGYDYIVGHADDAGANATAITNTYVSAKRPDIVVSKAFGSTYAGAMAPVTAVTLELRRSSAGEALHRVGRQ